MTKKRKPKTFVIHHTKSKGQQREFERLSITLRHLPENLKRIILKCPFCNAEFLPDWFKKHDISMAPVKPKIETKGVIYKGPMRWILQQVSQKCLNCSASIMINLPFKEMMTKGSLFGDDAKRKYKNKKVLIYSLVGTDQSLLPDLYNKINRLKQNLIPSVSPNSWIIHMKELWAGNARERHPTYTNLKKSDVNDFVNNLLEIIMNSNIFVYNIAVTFSMNVFNNGTQINRIRDEAFLLLILTAIDEWTSKNAQPFIFFDSEKDSKANKIIHGWAKDVFLGNQYSLLYGFLSKGIEIPEPTFVPPASFPGLELADFVSYTLGRYYFRKWQGKTIEIDPKNMGLVTYLGYDVNGDLLVKRQIGYPWDEFYEIKSI